MKAILGFRYGNGLGEWAAGLFLILTASGFGMDWPQYRGPNHDGISTDRILKQWPTNGPTVLWRNTSLTNGFSSFAVSQGRAFTLISRDIGGLKEVCVALEATTGTNIWATPIDDAPWDFDSTYFNSGGTGIAPCHKGDGPRSTPSVKDDRVFALSGQMHLVCMNATNGSVIWSNDLVSLYGASEIPWQNAASPCLDDDLLFVNFNTSTSGLTLFALRTTNGSPAWSSQNESLVHATPVVATIQGVRQVLFATRSNIVSLDRTSGVLLWKYTYPFSPLPTYLGMGASPVVHSNIIFCSAASERGSAAARITFTNGVWTLEQLWHLNTPVSAYQSAWMTPVCYQGYLYGQFGNNTFTNSPLNCIELATGDLKWSTNGFGQGGTILVDNAILALTEDGQLVLVEPNPDAYTELARYRVYTFSDDSPGKCWNSPAVADGFIYARSTREGVKLDVSVPSPLKMLTPQFVEGNQLQLWVGTTGGGAIDTNRLAKLEIRHTTNLAHTLGNWPKLTNSLVLTNGMVRVDNVDSGTELRRYFIAVEQP